MSDRPTLKTIAQMTGLAVPTISRALSGAEDISLATRARVRAVADEIGYVPNRAGVRLRTGRTNVVSLVLSTDHDLMNHTAKLINSIAAGLRDTPFHLIITPFFADEDPMKPIRYVVETESADVVIFNQIEPGDPRVSYLIERGFPFVTHGRSRWADRHPYVDFDNNAFARIAIETLSKRGRRKIVLIAPPTAQTYAQTMIEGASDAARAAGSELTILPGATSDANGAAIETALTRFLETEPNLDGIICASSNAGLSCITALGSSGRTIGADIDVVAKEAAPFLKRICPAVIIVTEDVGMAGKALADAAISRALRPDEPFVQLPEVPASRTPSKWLTTQAGTKEKPRKNQDSSGAAKEIDETPQRPG